MMSKLKLTNKKNLTKAKIMLKKARNTYDNELLEIERVWSKLAPKDYTHRNTLIRVATEMIEIDKGLKVWESKLKIQS